VLAQGGYVPANKRLPHRAHELPLVFVDPAVVLDEDAKWKKLYAEIVLGGGDACGINFDTPHVNVGPHFRQARRELASCRGAGSVTQVDHVGRGNAT
jgi:hypothetical protein